MEIVAALGWSGIIAVTVIAAAGSAVQASTGFGLALLIVPLLALLDPGFVPGPLIAAGIICSLGAAWRDRASIDWPTLRLALYGMAVGTLIGVAGLKATQGTDLSKVFGVLVLLAVAISVSGIVVRATRSAFVLGGAAGGLMGSMVGIHGPPLALVLQHEPPPKVRAMLGAFFTVAYAWGVAIMAAFGLFGWAEVARTAILTPGMCLGLALAPLLIAKIDRGLLRWIILSISTASGILLLFR
jgi:uncharacterized protein